MPPLAERREDVPLLVERFANELRAPGAPAPTISREALKRMLEYPWPGNVRELRNAVEHALVVSAGEGIGLFDLPPELRDWRARAPRPGTVRRVGDDVELTPAQREQRERIRSALAEEGGNRTRAAQRLGWSRVTLWKKMRRLGIEA
jgi:DNA-binding NtrC family response regulator